MKEPNKLREWEEEVERLYNTVGGLDKLKSFIHRTLEEEYRRGREDEAIECQKDLVKTLKR